MNSLINNLNQHGRDLTLQQLKDYGVKALAATTPISSFIGKYKGRKIYMYHDYQKNNWTIGE